MSHAAFLRHVDSLDIRRGHPDDVARKKRRIERLKTEFYEENDFTPRDLTVTSQLARLAAQVLLRSFAPEKRPEVVSLPGSITAEVRKGWRLLGCLGLANPETLMEDGSTTRTKTEIRGITHLHHALDACTLGLACCFFPKHGDLWQAMLARRPTSEQRLLLASTQVYSGPDDTGRMVLKELPSELKNNIRLKLAERRVVQHIPSSMSGIKVEENTRGVKGLDLTGKIILAQRGPRDARTGLREIKPVQLEVPQKLLGLRPPAGKGKLLSQKGVRVITANFGLAILDHAPAGEDPFEIIPWHQVWFRLQNLRLKNSGRPVRVLRNGMLIRLQNLPSRFASRPAVWRVFSIKQSRKLDLGSPDRVGMEDRGPGIWREVSLDTLGPQRIEILTSDYTGIPLPLTEDTSRK
jgi:CRISPR-associated endonuclease Csn1